MGRKRTPRTLQKRSGGFINKIGGDGRASNPEKKKLMYNCISKGRKNSLRKKKESRGGKNQSRESIVGEGRKKKALG